MPDMTGRVYADAQAHNTLPRASLAIPLFNPAILLQKASWLPNPSPMRSLCCDTRAFTARWQSLSCGEGGETLIFLLPSPRKPSISCPYSNQRVPVLTGCAPQNQHPAAVLSPPSLAAPLQPSGDTLHLIDIPALPPLFKSGRSCDAGICWFCCYFKAVGPAEPRVPCAELLPPAEDAHGWKYK